KAGEVAPRPELMARRYPGASNTTCRPRRSDRRREIRAPRPMKIKPPVTTREIPPPTETPHSAMREGKMWLTIVASMPSVTNKKKRRPKNSQWRQLRPPPSMASDNVCPLRELVDILYLA